MTPRRITVICPNCSGSGEDPLFYHECRECSGYGEWEEIVDPVSEVILGLREGDLGLTTCEPDPLGDAQSPLRRSGALRAEPVPVSGLRPPATIARKSAA